MIRSVHDRGELKCLAVDPIKSKTYQLSFPQYLLALFFQAGPHTATEAQEYLEDRYDLSVDVGMIERFLARFRERMLLELDGSFKLKLIERAVLSSQLKQSVLNIIHRGWRGKVFSDEEKDFISDLFVTLREGDPIGAFELATAAKKRMADPALPDWIAVTFREKILEVIEPASMKLDITRPFVRTFNLVNPERFLNRMKPLIFAILSPVGGITIGIAFVIALVIFFSNLDSFANSQNIFSLFTNVLASWGLAIVAICFHEFGHAFMCYRFGGKVRRMGVMLIGGIAPGFFADVSDTYFFPLHRRIIVMLSGMGGQLVLWTIGVFMWKFSPPESVMNTAAIFFVLMNGFGVFMNLIPFFVTDGYYILNEFLRIDNLYRRSMVYSSTKIRNFIFGTTDDLPEPPLRERIYFWSFFFAGIAWLSSNLFLGLWLLPAVWKDLKMMNYMLLFFSLGGIVSRLGLAIPARLKSMKEKYGQAGFLQKVSPQLRRVAIAAVILVFLRIPFPYRVQLSGSVQPKEIARIRSLAAGYIEDVRSLEGDRVSKNQEVISMLSPQLAAEDEISQWQLEKISLETAVDLHHLTPAQRALQEKHLETSQARLENAKKTYALRKSAQEAGLISGEDFLLETNKYALEAAKMGIAQADADRALAQPTVFDVRMAKGSLDEMKTKIEGIKTKIAGLQLKSPLNGTVIQSPALIPGQYVEEGQTLLSVADDERVLEVLSPEEWAEDISDGAKFEFAPASGEAIVQGHVILISPVSIPQRPTNDRPAHFPMYSAIRIRGKIEEQSARDLRFGITGQTKFNLGNRSLGYILYRKIFRAIRVHIWASV